MQTFRISNTLRAKLKASLSENLSVAKKPYTKHAVTTKYNCYFWQSISKLFIKVIDASQISNIFKFCNIYIAIFKYLKTF